MKIHLHAIPFTLDPHKMEDLYSMLVIGQVFRGLFRYMPDGELVPDLVESWKENESKIYSFKLKKRHFSNGKLISSNDVLHSFARLFYLNASICSDFNYLKGINEFQSEKDIKRLGIKVLSESEIEFTLEKPTALFLKHLATIDCAVMSIENYQSDLKMGIELVASGPYKVGNISKNDITLVKWRHDEKESFNPPSKITFFGFGNKAKVFDLAKEKKTDSVDLDNLDNDQQQFLKDLGWKKFVTNLSMERFVILNPKYLPKEARQWMFAQVNTEEILKELNNPNLKPAYGLIPNTLPGQLEKNDVQNINNPNDYLSQGQEIELDFPENDDCAFKMAIFLKAKWEKSGLRIILKPYPRKHYLERMFSMKSQAVIGSKGLDYPEGYSILTYFQGGYTGTYFHLNDEKINNKIKEAVEVIDEHERIELYKNIQKEILNHFTVIPLYFGSLESGLWSPQVEEVPEHPLGLHFLPFETIAMKIIK